MASRPRAILFDLDDTLISAYGNPERAWVKVAGEFAGSLPAVDAADLARDITRAAAVFWSDEERHRIWRHKLTDARRSIVLQVFAARAIGDSGLADVIAQRYSALRNEEMHVFPGALEVLDALRGAGVTLGLITNGSAAVQREKISRFGLGPYFNHVQIEGEHGFGKPEERSYRHALSCLGVGPHDAWIVGDNLVWEVEAPQKLGLHSVWFDGEQKGLPVGSAIKPDLIIHRHNEILDRLAIRPDV
jgi:putative hydrolase of the HAD superfamily